MALGADGAGEGGVGDGGGAGGGGGGQALQDWHNRGKGLGTGGQTLPVS